MKRVCIAVLTVFLTLAFVSSSALASGHSVDTAVKAYLDKHIADVKQGRVGPSVYNLTDPATGLQVLVTKGDTKPVVEELDGASVVSVSFYRGATEYIVKVTVDKQNGRYKAVGHQVEARESH